MREINFRGKTVDTGEWVYGSYQADVMLENKHTIIYSDSQGYYCEDEVIPETVGQYTGLKDKNGKEIYEGDILNFMSRVGGSYIGVVVWEDKKARYKVSPIQVYVTNAGHGEYTGFELYSVVGKVIGDIYNNPELLNS